MGENGADNVGQKDKTNQGAGDPNKPNRLKDRILSFCRPKKTKPSQPSGAQGNVTHTDQLNFLMDYTKFHIGLYATVITILVAIASIGEKTVPCYYRTPVLITLACVLLAGAAGGIIAAHIPEQTNFDDFWRGHVGPWGCQCFCTKAVARFEHFAFWVGVINAVLAVGMGENYFFASDPCPPATLPIDT